LIVTLPTLVPLAAGVKVTLMAQLVAGSSVPPFTQAVPGASAKSPLTVKPDKASGVVPVLVSVTLLAPLVVFTFWFAKFRR
jgi:hypothetical protein